MKCEERVVKSEKGKEKSEERRAKCEKRRANMKSDKDVEFMKDRFKKLKNFTENNKIRRERKKKS